MVLYGRRGEHQVVEHVDEVAVDGAAEAAVVEGEDAVLVLGADALVRRHQLAIDVDLPKLHQPPTRDI